MTLDLQPINSLRVYMTLLDEIHTRQMQGKVLREISVELNVPLRVVHDLVTSWLRRA